MSVQCSCALNLVMKSKKNFQTPIWTHFALENEAGYHVRDVIGARLHDRVEIEF